MAEQHERETAAKDLAESEQEAREIGARLREARQALQLSVVALADQAGVARTYVHDVEAGRKFANRPLVEVVAKLAPHRSDELLKRYDELAQLRLWRGKRPGALPARDLARTICHGFEVRRKSTPRGAAPSLPDALVAYDDFSRSRRLALNVLTAASRHRKPRTLVLSCVPFELLAAAEWQNALQATIGAGWDCIHIVEGSLDRGQQVTLLRQGLEFLGLSGRYFLGIADPSRPVQSFIVAEGVGSMEFLRADSPSSDRTLFFPWAGPTDTVAKVFLEHGRMLRQISMPLLRVYDTRDSHLDLGEDAKGEGVRRILAEKVHYDMALTDAECRPGDRYLVKSGLLVSTVPPDVSARQAERWKRDASSAAEAKLIDIFFDNRKRRWNALRTTSEYVSQDVCTKTAIESYLLTDVPHNGVRDPFNSGKYLTRSDRISHIRAVVDLVKSTRCSYTFGLADSPDSLASPVGDAYWEVAGNMVFMPSFYRGDPSYPVYVSIGPSEIVQSFVDLAQLVWDELPSEGRDQRHVVDWIEARLDEAMATQ